MPDIHIADSDDEAQLVMRLRRYATRKQRRRVVVVFDHGVYGHPQSLNGYGVECYFAKSPKDADSHLINKIRHIRRKGDWQVVTSDRAVAGEAHTYGIQVVSAQAFAKKLQTLNEPDGRLIDKEKERRLNAQEVEEWLRIFGVSADEDAQPE